MMTLEPHLESWDEPEVAKSEMWRIWWLEDGWNLVLHQNTLQCEGGVTGCSCLSMANCSTLICPSPLQLAPQITHSPIPPPNKKRMSQCNQILRAFWSFLVNHMMNGIDASCLVSVIIISNSLNICGPIWGHNMYNSIYERPQVVIDFVEIQ